MIFNTSLLDIFTSKIVIVIFAALCGSLVGEVRADIQDGIQSYPKLFLEILTSTLVGIAISSIIISTIKIDDPLYVLGVSFIFGFIGHKNSIKYLPFKRE